MGHTDAIFFVLEQFHKVDIGENVSDCPWLKEYAILDYLSTSPIPPGARVLTMNPTGTAMLQSEYINSMQNYDTPRH